MTHGISDVIHYENQAGRLRREREDWKEIAEERAKLLQQFMDWYVCVGNPSNADLDDIYCEASELLDE